MHRRVCWIHKMQVDGVTGGFKWAVAEFFQKKRTNIDRLTSALTGHFPKSELVAKRVRLQRKIEPQEKDIGDYNGFCYDIVKGNCEAVVKGIADMRKTVELARFDAFEQWENVEAEPMAKTLHLDDRAFEMKHSGIALSCLSSGDTACFGRGSGPLAAMHIWPSGNVYMRCGRACLVMLATSCAQVSVHDRACVYVRVGW